MNLSDMNERLSDHKIILTKSVKLIICLDKCLMYIFSVYFLQTLTETRLFYIS